MPADSTSPSAVITGRSGSSFLVSFRALPRERRPAMVAIYAFCRVVDDAVDDNRDPAVAAAHLQFWADELERAAAGTPGTPVGRDLHTAMTTFGLAAAPLREVVAGMRMDLAGCDFADATQLLRYCHCVASAVGLACLPVMGVRGAAAERFADDLGKALQLTNILRDLHGDAAAQRCYVPRDWLAEAGVQRAWLDGSGPAEVYRPEGPLHRLERRFTRAALAHFLAAAQELATMPAADLRRLLPARVMGAVYRELLTRCERRAGNIAVRPRLSRWRKLWLLALVWAGVRR